MRIGITGATGFIGTHLSRLAIQRGHEIIAYSRSPRPGTLMQPSASPWALPQPEQPLDVLIHLSGEPVFGLWTTAKRARIQESRGVFTERMVDHLSTWTQPPSAFLVASGVGYYGDRSDEVLTESSSAGSGFLAEVCLAWEAAAERAKERLSARVVQFRTGLVLGKEGGALPLMRRAFGLGAGGNLGSGRQWMPWIHIADEVGLMLWAAERTSIAGPLNLTAPNPVSNADFTQALAAAVHRPAFFHAPAFVLKTLLGDLAEEMLLTSQRALPAGAQSDGYVFQYPDLRPALSHLLAS